MYIIHVCKLLHGAFNICSLNRMFRNNVTRVEYIIRRDLTKAACESANLSFEQILILVNGKYLMISAALSESR